MLAQRTDTVIHISLQRSAGILSQSRFEFGTAGECRGFGHVLVTDKIDPKSTTKSVQQLATAPCSWLCSTKGQQSVRSITRARKLGGQLGKASDKKPRLW